MDFSRTYRWLWFPLVQLQLMCEKTKQNKKRLLKNPLFYGITYQDLVQDPHLYMYRKHLLEEAALKLARNKMARFDKGENFYTTDIGRIASYYYIDCETINEWNEKLTQFQTVEQLLTMICIATEFKEMQVREDEEMELKKLQRECCPYEIPDLSDSPSGKANILLQVSVYVRTKKEITCK